MALFPTHCAICKGELSEDALWLGTSGVAFSPPHPLYPFCDSGMHQSCLLNWEHRREFSSGYAQGSGHLLRAEPEWNLICGPLGYGPHGKPGWPYYAEIRLLDWPIRLYAKFEAWGHFIANKEWERNFIPEINDAIARLGTAFPQTDSDLREYLWGPLLNTMLTDPEHRARYVATVTLNLYDDEKIRSEVASLERALDDQHGSVRNAAHLILKRLRNSVKSDGSNG